MNVFCYGTLMVNRIWSMVVKSSYKKLNGAIFGYRRLGIRNEIYPCLVKGTKKDVVKGVVYLNVKKKDCNILDAFEGACYERIKEKCQIEHTGSIDVDVYVLKKEYLFKADEKEWDFDWFEKHGINIFISKYEGFLRMNQ